MEHSDRETGVPALDDAPPEAAGLLFRARLPLAQAFWLSLATDAVERGLIGPREVPRLWDRHILNCAVIAELIADGDRIVDIGSGAGLPGIAVAIARPEVTVTLVEPLLRRTVYLDAFVDSVQLSNVRVVRGRAEDGPVRREVGNADAVTSRAVSGFEKLLGWSAPLLREGGHLLAVKGSRAAEEIAAHTREFAKAGLVDPEVVVCGQAVLAEPTTVVRATRVAAKRRQA